MAAKGPNITFSFNGKQNWKEGRTEERKGEEAFFMEDNLPEGSQQSPPSFSLPGGRSHGYP